MNAPICLTVLQDDVLFTGRLGDVGDDGRFILENVLVKTFTGYERRLTTPFFFDFDEITIAAVYN